MAIIHVLAAKSLIGAILTWRRDLVKKFPDDPRNELAQDLLSTLSKQPANTIPADLVAKLDILKTPEFSHYANNLARVIGFKYFPRDLADFLEGVLKYAEEEHEAQTASPKQEGAYGQQQKERPLAFRMDGTSGGCWRPEPYAAPFGYTARAA